MAIRRLTSEFGTDLIATGDIATDAVTSVKIVADAVTSPKIAPDIVLTGASVIIPSVATVDLPGAGANASKTATAGMLVYDTTLEMLQQRSGGSWKGIATPPTLTSFQYSDGASATAEKTVVGLVTIACGTTISTTVTVAGNTLGIQIGMVVAGVGIPVGATVVSVIENVSFVLSSAATVIDSDVDLTFGGVVTITGTNFDSILGGDPSNIAVTFDGTSATAISVNAAKTIITCTPPAHAAGTIVMKITNTSGLSAETNFIYDIAPVFTTAAGTLGNFADGAYTANADAPRIQGTENSVALTTGFQRVTSATDDTVITTAIQNTLTLQTSGYLTGTLAGTNATTYPFYATAKDDEGQRTAPRLFNIISYDYPATGGIITTYSGFVVHTFLLANTGTNFTPLTNLNVQYLVVAGGGGGGGAQYAGGGGAGGFRFSASPLAVTANQAYPIVVGYGGAGGGATAPTVGIKGGNSSAFGILSEGGGTGGGHLDVQAGGSGGSGGGGDGQLPGAGGSGNGGNHSPSEGNHGHAGQTFDGWIEGGGGGGAGGAAVSAGGSSHTTRTAPTAGPGSTNYYRDGNSSGTTAGIHVFAGGGGGAWQYEGVANVGGIGGGGKGGGSIAGVGGTANSGGGGGGGGSTPSGAAAGGAGGSGIVVIRYPA